MCAKTCYLNSENELSLFFTKERKQMKIAFDAKRITHNATGLGNYSRFVVNELSSLYPEHTYQLYTPGKGNDALRNRIHVQPNISFHYPESRLDRLFPSLWRSSRVIHQLKKENIDLYHGLSNEIPSSLQGSGKIGRAHV